MKNLLPYVLFLSAIMPAFAQNDAMSIDSNGTVQIHKRMIFSSKQKKNNNAVQSNEIFFNDNGQIRSFDNNHRIIFNRDSDIFEIREYGKIIFSAGSEEEAKNLGQTKSMVIERNGNVSIGGKTSPTERLEVNGRIKDQTGYVMPVGSIIMYSPANDDLFDENGVGKNNSSVEGWAICNGKNGRPDLRGRFVVGAGGTDSKNSNDYNLTNYRIGDNGGEEKHKLSIEEMPRHKHTINNNNFGIHDRSFMGERDNDKPFKTEASNRVSTDLEGGDKPHENRPPYYALLYIIKL